MKKNRERIESIIMFFIILIIVASYILPRSLGDLDELWIYNSAKNMADGLLPYKDFNLVTTPFLPMLAGWILKILMNELMVMRVLAIILGTGIIFGIAKIMKEMKMNQYLIYVALIGITLLFKDYVCLDYNFINVFLILCILYLEIRQCKEKDNKTNSTYYYDFWIGILAGTSLGFKQTTGLIILIITLFHKILIIKGKEQWKEYGKQLVIRMLASLIPIGILVVYITAYELWPYFINYCILGVKEFSNVISYIHLWNSSNWIIKILAILLPIVLIYMYFNTIVRNSKTETSQKQFYVFCYSIAAYTVVFPISDEIHFVIGILPSLIGLTYILDELIKWINRKIRKDKIKIFIKEFVRCAVIILIILIFLKSIKNLVVDYFEKIKDQDTFLHYSHIPIPEGIYTRIKTVDNYIKEQDGKVYILDASAVIFKIPINQYDKHYDLFLKGNLGENGTENMIQEIQKLSNAKILIQKPPRNWQTPEEVIEFVENTKQRTGEIDLFYIYE